MLERLLSLIAMIAMMAPWTKTSRREVLEFHVLPNEVCTPLTAGHVVTGMIYDPDANFHTIREHNLEVKKFLTNNPTCNGYPVFSSFLGGITKVYKTRCRC